MNLARLWPRLTAGGTCAIAAQLVLGLCLSARADEPGWNDAHAAIAADRTDGSENVSSSDAKRGQPDAFRQLRELLPSPNEQRTASGAPGPGYWQQRADYVIDAFLDDANQRLSGTVGITYHNRSPHRLDYLWLQLDRNRFSPGSAGQMTETRESLEEMSFAELRRILAAREFEGGYRISRVEDGSGRSLDHAIVDTMMRVDLPAPLEPGGVFVLEIDFAFEINDSRVLNFRTAAEYFEADGNYIYEMAHWFPRMAAYTDYAGWQHKQFLGRGEFTLEFGDYEVALTVPDDHIVAATGSLVNADDVLSPAQIARLREARDADRPVFVVTPEEARENQSSPGTGVRTWVFRAYDVRDFAFASSRKFIWDAWGWRPGAGLEAPVPNAGLEPGEPVMCMSFYPVEGEPLWSRYSTQAIAHTLDVYSKHTFTYPYPTAQSVNGPVFGMEYPMICFNGPRPEEDGTYSERTKYSLINVIIHEVGHFYFPMIVNSDERQWTWMDEGLNTFLQYLAEQEWEDKYPSQRGEPRDIVGYMRGGNQVPIMTNSESLLQFGANAYAKPAAALNILRETVLGRELFDHALRTYARRWMFKRPEPADFFRTMEDASGVDLDWFWRGWFYSTDHVDIAITGVREYTVDTRDPDAEKPRRRRERDEEPKPPHAVRNAENPKRTDRFPELLDFYNSHDPLDVTPAERREFLELLDRLSDEDEALLGLTTRFYLVDLENLGGLAMPVILEATHADGTTVDTRIPAEIWRRNIERVTTMLVSEQEIVSLRLDPHVETADADTENNRWPRRTTEHRIRLTEEADREPNPMQEARDEEERAAREAEEAKAGDTGGGEADAGIEGGD